jgi:photosystem II stability/assembly factor-like uncharacterized protein
MRILCLSAIFLSFLIFFEPESEFIPIPGKGKTKIIGEREQESERQEQEARLAWINRIHKAAPGVDWRAVDRQTRINRYKERIQRGKSQRSNAPIEIEDGLLTGRWVEKGSRNNAGRTHMADYDTLTQTVYVVSDGGNVWKGNLEGTSWEVLNDLYQIENASLIRTLRHEEGMRIFVATWGKRACYSDDEGQTWNESEGFENFTAYNHSIERMVVADDSLHTIYAIGTAPNVSNTQVPVWIYRSIDRGTSFQRYLEIPQSNGINRSNTDIWLPQYGYCDPFVMVNNTCYRINVADSSIAPIGTLGSGLSGYCMLTGQLDGEQIRLYTYLNQKIYRSADAGSTWQLMLDLGRDPFFKTSFSASVEEADLLYFGDVECYKSLNGGETWTRISEWPEYYGSEYNRLHADIPAVNSLLDENGNEFQLINTDGGLYFSNTNLQIVDNISLDGLHISQYYAQLTAQYDTNVLYVGSQDQGYQLSTSDDGSVLDMEQVISGDYGHLVSSNEGLSVWMAYPGFALFYPFGTETGQSYSWDFNNTNTFWIPPLMPDPDDAAICFVATGSRLTKLSYTGSEIVSETMPQTFSGGVTAMAYSPVDHNRWYVLTESGRFYRSLDRGDTWSNIVIGNPPGANYLYGACILPSTINKDVIYIGGSGYSTPPVYKSTDNGTTFTAMNEGLPSTMVFRMAAAPGDEFLFAASEVGPYVYCPTTNRWSYLGGESAPDQSYWWVEYIPSMKTARFSTYGRGVWDFKISSPLAIRNNKAHQLSIFPNPSKSFFMLRGLNAGTSGQLSVYSLSGKLQFSRSINGTEPIDIENILKPGIYIVAFSEKGKPMKSGKLLVQ